MYNDIPKMNKEQFNYDLIVQYNNRANEIKRLEKLLTQLIQHKNDLLNELDIGRNYKKIQQLSESIVYYACRIADLKHRNGLIKLNNSLYFSKLESGELIDIDTVQLQHTSNLRTNNVQINDTQSNGNSVNDLHQANGNSVNQTNTNSTTRQNNVTSEDISESESSIDQSDLYCYFRC